MTRRLPIVLVLIGGCALWCSGLLEGSASAASSPAPVWRIAQSAVPTYLEPGSSPGGRAAKEANPKIRLDVANVGGQPFEEVVVKDTLPSSLQTVEGVGATWVIINPKSSRELEEKFELGELEENAIEGQCSIAGGSVRCEIPYRILPGTSVKIYIGLEVLSSQAEVVENEIVVESSGAPPASRRINTNIGDPEPAFAFQPSDEEGIEGAAYDQGGLSPAAGSTPFAVEMTAKVQSRLLAAGTPFYEAQPSQPLRSVDLTLPQGVVVNPLAITTRCRRFEFQKGSGGCPAASQVGVVYFDLIGAGEDQGTPLYVLVPEPGAPAELGFNITGAQITIKGGLSGKFSLTASSREFLASYPIDGVRVQLWGNPADPRHDRSRETGQAPPLGRCSYGCSVPALTRPFVTMPSACSDSVEFVARASSWFGPTIEQKEMFRLPDGQPEKVEGCAELAFNPSARVLATQTVAETPTGLDFDLRVPQAESPQGLATATVRDVSLQLPAGLAVNPSAANGLGACSPSEIGLGNIEKAACPNDSEVGTAEITTPLLESPLKGDLYLAEQNNNPFHSLLALYLAVEGEGITIKLPGRVTVDQQTDQVTTTFDDNPQLPFEELRVELNSGPRAALVTAPTCGTYNARTELTSWASSTPKVLMTPITVDQGCSTGKFAPSLEAGTSNAVAGQYSPFTLRVTRADGEQNLSKVSATLPEGLLAKLAGVPLCSEAQAGSGNCPASSQIGTTTTGVGAGPLPLYIPQAGKSPTAIYLAGPYKGAPYSLDVKVPAQAGPFDLGTISVRVALNVDPFTAQVTASSDALPQILEGIPVAYRDVRVEVSRSEFVRNPTNCGPKQILSSLTSNTGAMATPSSRFQVAGCSSLAFKPSLKLSLKGSTKRTGHPGLKAVLTYPKKGEYANIERAQVNLPHSEFLDQGNLNKTCTRPVLIEGKCPKTSVYGKARAWTPLLERPLEGPVYLVGGFGYKLPALVAELNGQLRVLLKGKVDTGKNHGIRNTFEAVPDAPVSRFVLELKGGKKYSLLENSENLCQKPQRAIARFTGQNGAVELMHPLIANQCGHKHKKAAN